MKIAYLAARNSVHTVRWVNALAQRGHTLWLITLHDGGEPVDARVEIFKLPIPAPLGYVLNVPFLNKLLKRLQPEILHVHYASGYGTLGRFSRFQPLILSVWGSDVFDFPNQSRLHRTWLRNNLQAARIICSTSRIMAEVTRGQLTDTMVIPPDAIAAFSDSIGQRLTSPDAIAAVSDSIGQFPPMFGNESFGRWRPVTDTIAKNSDSIGRGGQVIDTIAKNSDSIGRESDSIGRGSDSIGKITPPITVIPFGIDTSLFYPRPELRDPTVFKIGTVKTLSPKYGIDTLIRAFFQVHHQLTLTHPELAPKLRLSIAGSGPQQAELQGLVQQLGLTQITEFAGQLPHSHVPHYLNQLDIYVAASRLDSESFGVAILEASACGLPVVVSRVGGLTEVVKDGVTGYVVEKDNLAQFTQALLNLLLDSKLRANLGQAGRQWVQREYEWEENVTALEKVYRLETKFLQET